MKVTRQVNEAPKGKQGRAFSKYAYYLAWLSFVATVGMAIFKTLNDHHPPERNEYIH